MGRNIINPKYQDKENIYLDEKFIEDLESKIKNISPTGFL